MKNGKVGVIVGVVLVCCAAVFAGPELPSKTYYAVPAAPVKRGFWQSVKAYTSNRFCDVKDVVAESVDAVVGIGQFDPAADDCAK